MGLFSKICHSICVIFDRMDRTNDHKKWVKCLNCENPLHEEALYCYHCGQGIKDSRLSIMQVIKEAFVNFFNLDSRFLLTLRDLYSPSKLTKTYVAGKRKFYMNPARVFIVSLILLITVAMSDLDLDHVEIFSNDATSRIELAKQKKKWDALMANQRFEDSSEMLEAVSDSLFGNIHIDSMFLTDGVTISGKSIKDYKIKVVDAYELTGDELLDKYKIEGFGNKLYVKQYHKMLINPSGGVRYIIKNATWVVLILVFVMAIFMKLYYIRSDIYYVEHLVLLMYGHSLLFIATSILLLLVLLLESQGLGSELSGPLLIVVLVFQYLSLKKYYGQGWFKTLLKMLLINLTYLIAGILIFTLGALISFAIF